MTQAGKITVDTYQGEVATVNSYIFSNGESQVVMDVQRATSEARKLADRIREKGLPLTHIIVSHGHPDHYTGMDWLLKEFPAATVVVASEAIKQDIIGFSTWMESIGWWDAEPALKPKSDKNPNGFDYDSNISVLDGDTLELDGGGALHLVSDYAPTECDHLTTIYVPDLNGLFTADLCYNRVHLWMGPGVTEVHIQNWKDQLTAFKEQYADRNPVIYPGHGEPSDLTLIDDLLKYINAFQEVVAKAPSRQWAMTEMKTLYPDYAQADFLLKHSVDFYVKE